MMRFIAPNKSGARKPSNEEMFFPESPDDRARLPVSSESVPAPMIERRLPKCESIGKPCPNIPE
jgi:hypothetical protein